MAKKHDDEATEESKGKRGYRLIKPDRALFSPPFPFFLGKENTRLNFPYVTLAQSIPFNL